MNSIRSSSVDIYGGEDTTELPAYPIVEAARVLSLSPSNVRAWTHGQPYQTGGRRRFSRPVIQFDDPARRCLSFRNLVELHVLSAIRREHGVSLQNARRAVDFMRKRLESDHPFASQRMLTDGKDLLIHHVDELLNVSRAGQVEMSVVSAFLERIEFGRNGALLRLYPFTTTTIEEDPRAVVIDPRVQFGRPCLRGTGIPTDVILDRFESGETIDSLATDYEVEPRRIEEAIRFERSPRAA